MPSHTASEIAKKRKAKNGLLARQGKTAKPSPGRLQKLKQSLLRRQHGATPVAFGTPNP